MKRALLTKQSLPALLATVGVIVAMLVAAAPPAEAERAGGATRVTRFDSGSIDAGGDQTCAITRTGGLRCWGQNDVGQLGQGNTEEIGNDAGESTVAVDLGPRSAVSVSSGDGHTCVVLNDGVVRCWGLNSKGQLGQGNIENIGDEAQEAKTVVVDLGGAKAADVAAGSRHTCVLLVSGSVRCWGENSNGQLAQGNESVIGDTAGETTVAVNLGGVDATAISSAGNFTCAVMVNRTLRCWGYGIEGEMAQGDTNSIGDDAGETTVAIGFGGHQVLAVAAGVASACAIIDNGTVRCWGPAADGQLGQGNTLTIGDQPGESPVPVDLGARKAIAIEAGSGFCAILDNKKMRCWGPNLSGQLGIGTSQDYGDDASETTAPVNTGTHRVIAVSNGDSHTCAVWGDRSLHCWGNGFGGELGLGDAITTYGSNPGQTPGLLPATQLGGQLFGRDRDADGVRDAADACPAAPAPTTVNAGCQVTLKGRLVYVQAFVKRVKPFGYCPARALVVVKKGTKVLATKRLLTDERKWKGARGCVVGGQVRLDRLPAATATIKVAISGFNIKTRRITAVRI